ncbi:TetR/AcrR family transcriptional regulator [Hasllibacter sp. MH4015]|uniref:TetR/AcrR family transcriptional regulator n=1 Tax=Hasllibacter sp. MH4015 TaxID=2854029 RepID=UPI001CD7FECE|nr:TetR/AcrR family transcriptional regulator [Hasllibacter sp. MH4015]
MSNRLTPEDWIAAGFRALSETGPQALKAEALARRLKTTKGSFYHHFKDVPAYHAAMLALWQDKAFTGIVDGLADIPTPQARLRALARLANDGAPDRFGGLLIEPAIRAWSLHDANVADAVAGIDAKRIAYVGDLLEACGQPRRLAILFYGAFIGLDDLQARGCVGTAGALTALVEHILASPSNR